MKRLLLSVALLLVVAVASAQVTTSSVRGRVTTNDNPLPGATIVATHTPSGTNYGTTSNGEGHFVISGMRVGGPYNVTISFIGYNDVVIADLMLGLGNNAELSVELTEAAIKVEDIVISASSKNLSGDTFLRNEIEAIPSIDQIGRASCRERVLRAV